ncbi:MAG: HlyD family efflux transporter periplasmic adaptor subunit [Phycisphaerae bacterium]
MTPTGAHPVFASHAAAPPRRDDPFARLVRLSQQAKSPGAFLQHATSIVAGAVGARFAAASARLPTSTLTAEHGADGEIAAFWKPAVSEFLLESLAEARTRAKAITSRDKKQRVFLMFAPIFSADGAVLGGLAMAIAPGADDIRPRIALLESLAALCSYLLGGIGRGAASDAGAPDASWTRAATYETPEALAFSIVGALRNKFSCEQVAIGLSRRKRVRVVAVSGLDDVKPSSPGVATLRAAMEECLDAGSPLVAQRRAGWNEDGMVSAHRLHLQWQQQARGSCVASIPLKSGGEIAAIVSLRRSPDEPFTRELLEQIRRQVEPLMAALSVLRRASRGVVVHAIDDGRALAAWMLTPKRPARRALGVALALFVAWFCFASMPYDVRVPCTVQPRRIWHASMPFEGVLAAVHVRVGDHVDADQVLCELDTRDLELAAAAARADRDARAQEHMRALAADARADAQLAEAAERLADARLRVLERRIEQARIRAPFAGVIIASDAERRGGAVLRQGEMLFQVVPQGAWTLELSLDQQQLADVAPGQAGRFAGHARPESAHALKITRVRPAREMHDGHGVYVAEAELDGNEDWLRPGVEGLARVNVGPRRVAWIALHRVADFLRLRLWL